MINIVKIQKCSLEFKDQGHLEVMNELSYDHAQKMEIGSGGGH